MAGKIRTKEKCPKCGGAFIGAPLSCANCKTAPRRYFIDYHHRGHGRLKIYADRAGNVLSSWEHAERTLSRMRSELDDHTFDPTKYAKKDLKTYLFETRIEAWYSDKTAEVRKGNLSDTYTNYIDRYIRMYYTPFFKDMDVRDIRTFNIHAFYKGLPDTLSLKYVKNILSALENFFNTLHRLDVISEKPSFPIVTVDRRAPKWIGRDLQMKALSYIPTSYRPIFTFLMLQGVRPGEAIGLKVKDIDLDNEVMVVNRTYTAARLRERVKSKVFMPRALNPALIPMLRELCRDKLPEAFVFLNGRSRHFSDSNLRRFWHIARKAIGIDLTLYEATRHSWATNALNDGADLKSIGDVLGHTDTRTTLKYAHGNIINQRGVFQKQGTILALCPQTVPSTNSTDKKGKENKQ